MSVDPQVVHPESVSSPRRSPARRWHRLSVLTAGITLAALTLGGCSSAAQDTSGTSASDSSDSVLPDAEGTTTYPLVLESAWGETTLEERPERIAVVDSHGGLDTQLLISLGIAPVIAGEAGLRSYPTQQALAELPTDVETVVDSVYDGDPYYYEEVAASDPDLIIATRDEFTQEQYDKLAAIAPVLAPVDSGEAADLTWQERIVSIGEALDLSDEAQNIVDETDDFFVNLRNEYPEFDGLTIAKVNVYGGEYGMLYDWDSTVQNLYTLMGFGVNPLAEQFADNTSISTERISDLEGDILIVGYFEDGESEMASLLTDQPLFSNLSEVQNDKVVYIKTLDESYVVNDEEYEGNLGWDIGMAGPLSGPWAATQLAGLIAPLL